MVGSCFLGEHLPRGMHSSPLAGVYRLRPTGGDTRDDYIWAYEQQQLTTLIRLNPARFVRTSETAMLK